MKPIAYQGKDVCVFCRFYKGTERTVGAGRPCCYMCCRVRWVF
jgi:hypothetical protein